VGARPGALPNLIVIGAMKCATTALHRYLDGHPDIAMAEAKELNFFVGPSRPGAGADWHAGNWHRGIGWYAGQFSAGASIRGEASPSYTSPAFPEAAARMAATVPDARLVFLVRDPIDRALSQFRHHAADGTERRPFAEAVLDPGSQYVTRSRYHDRLLPFLERFAPDRIRVVLQEDLLGHRRRTLTELFRFAGVAEGPWPPAAERTVHVATAERPCLEPALEARLREALADDVGRLRELLGRSLGEWRAY